MTITQAVLNPTPMPVAAAAPPRPAQAIGPNRSGTPASVSFARVMERRQTDPDGADAQPDDGQERAATDATASAASATTPAIAALPSPDPAPVPTPDAMAAAAEQGVTAVLSLIAGTVAAAPAATTAAPLASTQAALPVAASGQSRPLAVPGRSTAMVAATTDVERTEQADDIDPTDEASVETATATTTTATAAAAAAIGMATVAAAVQAVPVVPGAATAERPGATTIAAAVQTFAPIGQLPVATTGTAAAPQPPTSEPAAVPADSPALKDIATLMASLRMSFGQQTPAATATTASQDSAPPQPKGDASADQPVTVIPSPGLPSIPDAEALPVAAAAADVAAPPVSAAASPATPPAVPAPTSPAATRPPFGARPDASSPRPPVAGEAEAASPKRTHANHVSLEIDTVTAADAAAIPTADSGGPAAINLPGSPTVPATDAGTAVAAGPSHAEQSMVRHLDLARDSQWLDRLAQEISQAASTNNHLKFQLNPEHLGSLQIEIVNSSAGTSVRMTADNDAARAIIADAQPRLMAEVRAQGLRIAESHVDLGNQTGSGNMAGGQRQSSEDHKPFVRTQAEIRAETRDSAPPANDDLYA